MNSKIETCLQIKLYSKKIYLLLVMTVYKYSFTGKKWHIGELRSVHGYFREAEQCTGVGDRLDVGWHFCPCWLCDLGKVARTPLHGCLLTFKTEVMDSGFLLFNFAFQCPSPHSLMNIFWYFCQLISPFTLCGSKRSDITPFQETLIRLNWRHTPPSPLQCVVPGGYTGRLERHLLRLLGMNPFCIFSILKVWVCFLCN